MSYIKPLGNLPTSRKKRYINRNDIPKKKEKPTEHELYLNEKARYEREKKQLQKLIQ